MPAEPIYLDCNSTTPIDPRVVEAMIRAWRDCGANPASQHGPGRRARRMIEEAREGILALLGAKTGGMDADQLVFTSGGTEANNLALFGLANVMNGGTPLAHVVPGGGIAFSAVEHPSITGAVLELGNRGVFWGSLKVNGHGVVDVKHFDKVDAFKATVRTDTTGNDPSAIRPPTLVSVMLANNETGVIQPVADIGTFFHERRALFHIDAVQAVGKIPVSFRELGVDAMTVAPHKFHGPLGIGALVVKHGVKLQPQLFGGFQQGGLRPGTENVALAVGFHEALKLAVAELPERSARMQSLRDELERALKNADRPESYPSVIVGEDSPRLPNTSCVSFPGLNRQALVMALDLAGVACSTGSACASGSSEPSLTLVAMGLPKDVVEGAIRLSIGAFTTPEEIAEASRRIINAVKHLRSAKTA